MNLKTTDQKKNRALLRQVSQADIRLLQVFIQIVKSQGLAAAELQLNISRSVISRYLKHLETRLGVVLCQRGRAGFALTAEGQLVYDAALKLLNALEHFKDQINTLNNEICGELHIAVFDTFVTHPSNFLATALHQFVVQAKEVTLHVHVVGSEEIEPGLLAGKFDFAIQPLHRESQSLQQHFLFKETMRAYISPSHDLCVALSHLKKRSDAAHLKGEAKLSCSLKQLRELAWVGLGYHSLNMEHFQSLRITPSAFTYGQEASTTFILSGKFVGFLPEHYAKAWVEKQLLIPIHAKDVGYTCDWYVFYARGQLLSRAANMFLACLQIV